ncbi:MAG: glycerol-3-phosphate 1-O-acyltransferase PlsY, partial [Lentisphaeraceae bacterium]|nr:glycerol-3-phosphate 1-O-acyltransferase PlsY [Lentisphaeraceae bacterium]
MTLPLLLGAIALFCYLAGSIPFGLLIGKLNKIDIRQHGSGNIGATNVLRTLGKKWGYTCFLGDFLKGLLPVLLCMSYAQSSGLGGDEFVPALAVICTVMGHIFSLFLKFKGGKGIATSAGAIMAIAPYGMLLALVLWIIIFKATGYVSLASIVAAIGIPFFALAENALKLHDTLISNFSIGVLFALGLLVTVKHKANIKRLMNGTESSFKKKKETE